MKKIKNKIRDVIIFILGNKVYTLLRFIVTHRYIPNVKLPSSYSEKIQNRKLFCEPSQFSKLVDKYQVRSYVSKVVGEKYLIPLIGRYKTITPSVFTSLPDRFVIKTSNGGGGVNVKVVHDKSSISFEGVSSIFNSNVQEKIGEKIGELFYDIEEASIIVEELIENSDGSTLLDYKFHVFKSIHGVKMYLQINSNYGMKGETKTLYDLNGNISEIQFSGYKYGPDKISLPVNFQEMVDLALKLSGELSYCRVDLYNVDLKIYFGELTLCPASGWDKINMKKYDFLLGSYWGP